MVKRKSRRGHGVGARAGAPAAAATVLYLESSAVVAALIESDQKARASIRARTPKAASALTFAETARALLRLKRSDALSAEQERQAVRALGRIRRRCYVVAVTEEVLERVGRPFPVEPIRTLDAIHLATAEFIGQPPPLVTIVTRDECVRANAMALGYSVE